MMSGGLTPDVPLGPFEGTPMAYTTAGKTARLHASLTCNRLRTGSPRELLVLLNAATLGRNSSAGRRLSGRGRAN